MAAIFVFGRADLWFPNHPQLRIVSTNTPVQIRSRPEMAFRAEITPGPTAKRIISSGEAPHAQASEATENDLSAAPPSVDSFSPLAPLITRPSAEEIPAIAPVTLIAFRSPGRQIRGRAVLIGEPPAERQIQLDVSCGKLDGAPRTTRLFVVGKDNALADVVVAIQAGLPNTRWPLATMPLVIASANCMFEPYVSAAQIGQRITIVNVDRHLHNAHVIVGIDSANSERNHALLPGGKPLEFTVDHPEDFLRLKCDVHPWMFAYISVFDHPFFAVTDQTGAFTISDLPPGRYIVSAAHRKAGTLSQAVEVTSIKGPEIEFRFTPPADVARN